MNKLNEIASSAFKNTCGDVLCVQTVQEREAEVKSLQEQRHRLQPELSRLRTELQEKNNLEEQLRQQIADKEEKTKKAFMGAKQKLNQLNS